MHFLFFSKEKVYLLRLEASLSLFAGSPATISSLPAFFKLESPSVKSSGIGLSVLSRTFLNSSGEIPLTKLATLMQTTSNNGLMSNKFAAYFKKKKKKGIKKKSRMMVFFLKKKCTKINSTLVSSSTSQKVLSHSVNSGSFLSSSAVVSSSISLNLKY